MRRTPAITWNVVGQLVRLLLPNGRPTSATFAVFRNYATDDSTAEFSGAATVDAVSTAITVAAGPAQADPQLLTLPVAGIAPGRYLLAQSSVFEWVDVVEAGAATIRVRTPLLHDYAIGATFKGCTLSLLVDPTFAADTGKLTDLDDTTPDYRVKWTIVIDGTTMVVYSFFDLVRAPVEHHVEIADVNERAFGLADSLPLEYREEQGRPLINGAWRAVRAHLLVQGLNVNALRDDEAIDELVILRSLRHLAEGGWHPPSSEWSQYLALVTGNYDRFFEQNFVVLKRATQPQLNAATTNYAPKSRDLWSK